LNIHVKCWLHNQRVNVSICNMLILR